MRRMILCAVCLTMAATSAVARRHAKQPEIPILAWHAIVPGQYQTLEHYQEMRDCGFTMSFICGCDHETAMKSLDLCKKVGMKSMFSCPELETETEKTVAEVKNHPALAGYFLRDEPQDKDFDEMGKWSERVRKADPQHTRYLNLLPECAFGDNKEAFKNHLRHFTDVVSLPQLSFDHYPIKWSGDTVTLCPPFYENLELVSAEARRIGVPFWAFALSVEHASYPVPRLEHLRLQLYADLAYGAQCLQYFTYWTPKGDPVFNYQRGPMSADGRRQSTYEVVREMNQELQNRAFVFVGCQVESVYHMGTDIPSGTTRLPALPAHFLQLDTHGQGAMISTLTNNGTRYYVIQNTNPNHLLKLDLLTDDTLQLVRRDGTLQPANIYGPYFELEVGDVLIFKGNA